MRAIDADEYMGLLKEQYLHNTIIRDAKAARAWQGAMQLLYDQPTLPQPSNEPLTCDGCACESYPRDCYPCNTCNRNDETLSDQYRPPEGEDGDATRG